MDGSRDPVEQATDHSTELYDVISWERRSMMDAFAVYVWRGVQHAKRWLPMLIGVLLLVYITRQMVNSDVGDPAVGLLVGLSVVPALVLAGFVWYSNVTKNEPIGTLAVTFFFGLASGPLAGVLNTLLPLLVIGLIIAIAIIIGGGSPDGVSASLVPDLPVSVALDPSGVRALEPVLQSGGGSAVGFVVTALFFFLVVGPVEETVKLLAVRVYAYRQDQFSAVIDGVVYGAVAGLGFATIENALYITQFLQQGPQAQYLSEAGLTITTVRGLAGPGHVIYSAIAGYYLGLAKFNREAAGPIVVKGLLLAAFFHATYNTLAGVIPPLIQSATPLGQLPAIAVFVVVYDTSIAYFLYRKVNRYRRVYRSVGAAGGSADPANVHSELTEYDPPSQTRRPPR